MIIDVTRVAAVFSTNGGLPPMKRREFTEIAAVGAAGVVLPTARADTSLAALLANPRLIEILHDERIVCELGRRYRESVPAEDNAERLAHAILGEPRARLQASDAPRVARDSLRARLADQVQRDFDDGRTVTLHGWILALTEARQCALFSLLPA
jgi:hypothetical protein